MIIDNKLELGSIVYLKTDKEQDERMVTGIFIRPSGAIIYYLSLGTTETQHYEIELSDEKNILITS